jgi:hypothetical protein
VAIATADAPHALTCVRLFYVRMPTKGKSMAASEAVKGVYTIRRDKTPNGRDFFHIEGWAEDGTRVRKRRNTETEAKRLKTQYEEKDEKFRKARDEGSQVVTEKKRSLWSSDLIVNQARVNDCEEALRLFPKTIEGIPDPRFSVRDAVAYALRGGFNPVLPGVTLNQVLPEYWKHIEWRASLPKTNEQRLGKLTKGKYPYYRRLTQRMFGEMQLSCLAANGNLKKLLEASSETINNQQKIASFVNGLMAWAMVNNCDPVGENPAPAHPQYIDAYTPYFPRNDDPKVQVEVMSLPEVQTQIDSAWNITMKYGGPRAAKMIVLIFCALRPSEVDHPDFSVDEYCQVARVPDDTKTGWRFVPISPNAQIMLKVLKERGLLRFGKESYVALAMWRGKLGYHASDTLMRSWLAKQLRKPYKEIHVAEARRLFRERYPFRPEFGRNVPDKPRHTGGSYHLTAGQSIEATATFMGNSSKVVKGHYWGKVHIQDVPRFYRIIPGALEKEYDASTIPMPFWFNVQHAEDAKVERERVEAAAAELGEHLTEQAAARAEERRQMLNRINRKCREKRGHIWNAKKREAYAEDPGRRERIQRQNRDKYPLHKDEWNAKRRERYATDAQHREKRLQENRESQLRRQAVAIPTPMPTVPTTE